MPAIATATDKRFHRAHVKPARKRSVRAKLAWRSLRGASLVALLMTLGWRAASLVADAQTLHIGHLVLRGHQRLAAGEVLALVDGLRGQNILTVRLDAWRQRLLSSPWVEDATIRRVLPSTIEIVVRERRPMGIGRFGAGLYLVDRQGVIIDEYGPNYADIDLPIVDGLATSPRDGSALVDPARAELAGRVITALSARPDLAMRVSQIDVTDLHDAIVILDGDTALLRLGESEFAERVQQYLDLVPAIRERLATVDYVDLRFDDRLYVQPARRESPASETRN